MDDPSRLGRARVRHRHRDHVAAAVLDQPDRTDRQLDPDRRLPAALIAPRRSLRRPLVRVWPAGSGVRTHRCHRVGAQR